MKKILIIFFFLTFTASAEEVITEGNYIYTGDISENEACSLAKERAKLKALEKVIGQKISSEEMENCSEVDGKTSCERNQFFLSSFNTNAFNLFCCFSNTCCINKTKKNAININKLFNHITSSSCNISNNIPILAN